MSYFKNNCDVLIFIQEKWTQSTEVQSDLNPAGAQHDPDPLAHGLGRQIPGKLGTDRSSIAMGSGDLPPDTPHLRLGVRPGNRGLVLGLVHVSASLANVPLGILLIGASLKLKQGSVLVLVPLPALVPGEHSLGVKTSRNHFGISCRSESSNISLVVLDSCWFLCP